MERWNIAEQLAAVSSAEEALAQVATHRPDVLVGARVAQCADDLKRKAP